VTGNVCPGARAQIAADKAAGYQLVLATASQRFSAGLIGEALGFDAVIASENIVNPDGTTSAAPLGANCYGAEKLRRIKAWLESVGISRDAAHVRFYSDHVSDAPCLAYADEPFAINAHAPLRALAARKGWPVLTWS